MADQNHHGAPPPQEARILGPQGQIMLEQAAVTLGIACTNCALPMSGPGFEFVSLRPVLRGGLPTVIDGHVFICHRDECAEAREQARQTATAVRPAGGWEVFEGKAEDEVDEPSAS
jgi:hypothetical protein